MSALEGGLGPTKTVVVLGKPRSGTSITAGLLSILGVDMSGDSSPTPFNPRGAYEDTEFNDLHSDILEAAGGDDLLRFPSHECIMRQKDKYEDRIRQFFSRKTKQRIWGWKKPSTSLLIELFLPHLINPHFVVVLRNPIGNARSLIEFLKHKYPAVDFVDMLNLINRLNGAIFSCVESHRDIPTLFLAFEDIVDNPIEEATRICQFLDLELNDDKVRRINELIIPRREILAQKKISFIRSLPYKSARVITKCYRDPANTKEYLIQSARLVRNWFGR